MENLFFVCIACGYEPSKQALRFMFDCSDDLDEDTLIVAKNTPEARQIIEQNLLDFYDWSDYNIYLIPDNITDKHEALQFIKDNDLDCIQ
jgi:hypothetical protein